MVGFCVRYYWYEIGHRDFLYSFFSTVAYRLENNKWGSVYPNIMNRLSQGTLEVDGVDDAINELKDIKLRLKAFRPDEVV